MAAMMNGSYPACRDIDFSYELFICETDEADVGDNCSSSAHGLPPLPVCEDGTWNRTCYPKFTHDVGYHMNCVCRSLVRIPDDVGATYWSGLESLSPPVDGVFYTRPLMMAGGECITQELIKMGPVVVGYDLPDSVFTASSIWSDDYPPYKARLGDVIETGACAWFARLKVEDAEPWLGITLPMNYFIKGCVISKTCSTPRPITMITVTTSDDDVIWSDVTVDEDISTLYDFYESAAILFSRSYTSRYWKIFVFNGDPTYSSRLRADLIGFLP